MILNSPACSIECKSLAAVSPMNSYEDLVSQFLFTELVTELEHVEARRSLWNLITEKIIMKIYDAMTSHVMSVMHTLNLVTHLVLSGH